MATRDAYQPGPAAGAEVHKAGDAWTLVLVRDIRHPPQAVWAALTDPAQLREWAPFDADRDLGRPGEVTLTTVGTPGPQASVTQVTRAEAPHALEYRWGGQQMRWNLVPLPGGGTRLTLWHAIDRNFISMGAAGWHICLDVMQRFIDGQPIGRLVAGDALKFAGWQRLNAEYAQQFGLPPPRWPGQAPA
jgi:uncharacterized protein YndB with AHSA1/START domain